MQVNSLGLTEQQPENNVYRILIEMLAVTLSKNARARAVQLPAWNEALGLPRPWDQQWSLRMQQILAYETDLLEYDDLFDGNPAIDRKVEALKTGRARGTGPDRRDGRRRRRHRLHEVPPGRSQRRTHLARIESGETTVVGVNRFTTTEPSPLTTGEGAIMQADPEAEADQMRPPDPVAQRTATPRASQDALAALRSAAQSGANIMPASIACAKAGVTTGEWGAVMRALSANTAPRPASPSTPRTAPKAWNPSATPSPPSPPNSAARSRSSSASPALTAIPTAPNRSPPAPATAAWRSPTTASA